MHRALGELHHAALDVGWTADEDGERVAVEPCDDIVGTTGAREPRGDAAEQLVADPMPERVIDTLEVVEVDDHHSDLARGARLERLADLAAEQRARGEPGERVVMGLELKLVLQIVQLGHGALVLVVLQRGARVDGQGSEMARSLLVKSARVPKRFASMIVPITRSSKRSTESMPCRTPRYWR